MYCPKCGTQNPDDAQVCANCGANMQEQIQQQAERPAPPRPQNYLVWSILTTLLCCLPAGIVSIIFAAQVDSKYNIGDFAGAIDSSNKARTWAWASFGIGLAVILLTLLLNIIGYFATRPQMIVPPSP